MPGLGRSHVHSRQGEDLEDARPGRGSGRDARLRLPEADRAASEREEGHRRRGHVEEAPSDAVREARAAGREARHPGASGARAGPRGSRAHGARAQEARPDRAPVARPADQGARGPAGAADRERAAAARRRSRQFRTKKEVIKAQYSAAEAQVRISEAANGVGEEMADLGLAMQRAEDKTEKMRARASAVEELEQAGAFDDITQLGSGQDDIDRAARASSRAAPRWTTSWPR